MYVNPHKGTMLNKHLHKSVNGGDVYTRTQVKLGLGEIDRHTNMRVNISLWSASIVIFIGAFQGIYVHV